jgi:hypothetical protein
MQRIRELIEEKASKLSQSPLLDFIQGEGDPRVRFSFVPCIAPWIMGFSELNKFVLRDESSKDAIQEMINIHSHEDDDHWTMYLKDVKTLGMNDALDFNGAVTLLWGEKTQKSRELLYYLIGTGATASPVMRMILVEAVEAASRTSFAAAFKAAEELRVAADIRLSFFGTAHMELEDEHTMRTVEAEEALDSIRLSDTEFQGAKIMVDKIFELFEAMFDEFLAYARENPRPLSDLAPSASLKQQAR